MIRPFLLTLSTSSILKWPSAIDIRPFQDAACLFVSTGSFRSLAFASPARDQHFHKQERVIHRIPNKEELCTERNMPQVC
jgi:hypothetical protein